MDVSSILPGSVTLTQVPAGSVLHYGLVDAADLPGSYEAGWPDVPLDQATGLPIIDRVSLDGLEAGPCRYELRQPQLGVVEGEFFVVGGEVGAGIVDWRSAAGVANVSAAYETFRMESDIARGPNRYGVGGAMTTLATLAVGAGSAYLLWQATIAQQEADKLGRQFDRLNASGQQDDAIAMSEELFDARNKARMMWVGAGVSGGVGATTLTVSVVLFGKSKRFQVRSARVGSPEPDPAAGAAPVLELTPDRIDRNRIDPTLINYTLAASSIAASTCSGTGERRWVSRLTATISTAETVTPANMGWIAVASFTPVSSHSRAVLAPPSMEARAPGLLARRQNTAHR